ncbi:hypothetical protein HID58_022058 [Brassica napus]|uniref:SHSP domain-containing protein n=1 Tax=Brassica napus TaxID=3708 RepID=A0ABQ8CY67_BRANA|nr:increased DNA methylation 3 [Brassica napus]KAH0922040.1 hypothetical protein HID58_022058 [Brassica napus]
MSPCKRKNEEEAVAADDAVCLISKAQEGISLDIPQRKGKEQECSREETSSGLVYYQDCNSYAEPRETCKRKKDAGGIISKTPERSRETYKKRRVKDSSTNKNGETLMEIDKTDEPTSLSLVLVPPEMKECDAEAAVITTGTASKGTLGSSIDIGVNKAAYFFQVALPGVCKASGEFSCEIESDGKVILEGSSTTGCNTIKRHSRVFKMNIRKLCLPGPFKLSFRLPGPVDPRLFSPNFRSDGIFEAVVIRQENLI